VCPAAKTIRIARPVTNVKADNAKKSAFLRARKFAMVTTITATGEPTPKIPSWYLKNAS